MTALLSRLASQVGSTSLARNLLIKRGHMTKSGSLTQAGKKRQSLGAAGRAKSRASKVSGKSSSKYKYNAKTNRATLK